MERLTVIDGIGQNELARCFDCCVEKSGTNLENCGMCEHWQKVLDKLAAYENTGMDPEHAAMWETNRRNSVTIGRMAEFLEAEKNGRVVLLPCKVGDWVYALWEVPTKAKHVIYCAEVKEIWISMRNCRLTTTYRLEPIEYRGRRREYRDDDFGKTVFLSEEEAKAALAESKDSSCVNL